MLDLSSSYTIDDLLVFNDFDEMWLSLTTYLTITHTNQYPREFNTSYSAYTIEEMSKIPTCVINDFLNDIKPALQQLHGMLDFYKKCMPDNIDLKEVLSIKHENFLWTDDNINRAQLNIDVIDTTPY